MHLEGYWCAVTEWPPCTEALYVRVTGGTVIRAVHVAAATVSVVQRSNTPVFDTVTDCVLSVLA
jgi:hypothetical protein